jgi:hypothetical protein
MATWALQAGVQRASVFEGVEVTRNLPAELAGVAVPEPDLRQRVCLVRTWPRAGERPFP